MSNTLLLPSWKAVLMIVLFSFTIADSIVSTRDQKVYIVYMGDCPKSDFSVTAQHLNILQKTLGSKRANESWLHSYHRSFSGFVAKLSEEERQKISSLEGVVSVFPSTKLQLHTTRSWDFIGLPTNVNRSRTESDVIIGLLDSGIWPESQSFNDSGLGPPPRKWKGSCQSSSNFTCNNKIIGAKYYYSEGVIRDDFASPRDREGHGSHTASIAGGDLVRGASLYGLGKGTARGGAPSARIAVYKVCWVDGCSAADILAAFDDAIADGVDIISLSLGGGNQFEYFEDPIAIGTFHAVKRGILTSASAGNNGPQLGTLSNFAPWIISVAASTIDRKFVSKVLLGNNESFEGVAINTFDNTRSYPLVYGGDVPASGVDSAISKYCEQLSIDQKRAKGRIILCDALADTEWLLEAGLAGVIMQDSQVKDSAFSYLIPASYVGPDDGYKASLYINETRNPTASIFKGTESNETSAPSVASFSSRGPNPVTRDIIKPDVTAPGVNILAAWSEAASVTGAEADKRIPPFNIISGTSMSCPHATGAAAYIKSFNPTWSPAAIKSALMTTASPLSNKTNEEAEFAYGSGHINPFKAKAPGLVYNITVLDYVKFLCGQGYTTGNLRLVTGDNVTCTEKNSTVYDLNYPSFSVSGDSESSVSAVFHRTVTNVGSAASTYEAVVSAPRGLSVQVQPSNLSFASLGETRSFVVTVKAQIGNSLLSGSLVWDDGVHKVRSPIVAAPTSL